MLLEERDLIERATHIDTLLADIESLPDPDTRAKAEEIVQGLLVLYGEGLLRMLTIMQERLRPEACDDVLEAFVGDNLISHLLLLHDLHPVSLETRILRALEEVRPYLQSHGGNVSLLGIEGGVARLRLQGSCSGCPSSTMTLKLAIEEAIQKVAPDLEGIEAEGVAEPRGQPVAFLPNANLLQKKQAPAAQPAWTEVHGMPSIPGDGMESFTVAGESLLFLRIEGTLYAYGNTCAGCSQPLDRGALKGADITCPSCSLHYDVRRAGRCLDDPSLHLEPIPLLVQDDTVKVAMSRKSF